MKEAVTAETPSIHIKLGHLYCKIKGIVCPNFKCGYYCGVNLVMAIKTHHHWESSVLTVLRKGVNYKVYQSNLNL